MLTLQSLASLVDENLHVLRQELLQVFQHKRSPKIVDEIYQTCLQDKRNLFHGMLVFLVASHFRQNTSDATPPSIFKLAKAAELLAIARKLYLNLSARSEPLSNDEEPGLLESNQVLIQACANYLAMESFYEVSDFNSPAIARSFSEIQKYFFERVLHHPIAASTDNIDIQDATTKHMVHLYCHSGCFFEQLCQCTAKLCGGPEYLQVAFARYGRHVGIATELLAELAYFRRKPNELLAAMQVRCTEPGQTLAFILAMQLGTAEEKWILTDFLSENADVQSHRLSSIHRILEDVQSISSCQNAIYQELQAAEEALQIVANHSWKSILVALLNGLRQHI